MVSRRVVRSYQARYSMGTNKASMYDLTDAIDVHAHARGQDEEEPMHAAQEATRAGMKAVLFKSISPGRPWEVARRLQDDVDRWAERENLRPVKCLSAWIVGIPLKPIDFTEIKAAVEGGILGMWMPPVTSAWSIFRLGGRGVWFDKTRGYDDPVPPTAWEDARTTGIYVLDDHGRLLPAIRDTVRLCADHGVALSFGHLSPQEMDALAEEIGAIGYRRAFIDHPFSEVFEFDVPKMQRWAQAGVRFALTWDELSPLLGVDPQDMVAAIRAIGPEHFMLSSDAGIPLLAADGRSLSPAGGDAARLRHERGRDAPAHDRQREGDADPVLSVRRGAGAGPADFASSWALASAFVPATASPTVARTARLAAEPMRSAASDRAARGVLHQRSDVGAEPHRRVGRALDRLAGHAAHVPAHAASRLHGVARRRARRSAELAPDLLGRFDRAHDRVAGDGAEIRPDLAGRANRAAHRGDRRRAHLAADVARAGDRRHERVLDQVHHAGGDGPASADRFLNRRFDVSVATAARRSRAVLGPLRRSCASSPFLPRAAWLPFRHPRVLGRFRSIVVSDASTRLSPRTASGTATPPATSSQSESGQNRGAQHSTQR